VAKQTAKRVAKRATRPNPREDRNYPRLVTDQFDDSNIKQIKKPVLIPRNIAQEVYCDVLEDDTKHIVFAMGPAGCGKTYLAAIKAVAAMKNGEVDKIIITRPAVSVDEKHGFLPGTLIEKMAPWVTPIMDVFKEYYSVAQIERMLEEEKIEIAPLAYMRGRTFKKAIVLFDEAQNATPDQMKMVLTRIGDGCRMIITGDLAQHDRGFDKNGLKDFVERLERRGSKSMSVCRFAAEHVERHPVIEEILGIYDA
jgi:phosphate starvation-inducible PhoH-like protein